MMIRTLYIAAVAATILVRVVILVRSWRAYKRGGEEGLRRETKQQAVAKIQQQITKEY